MHCSIPKRPALRVEVEYLPRRLRVVVRDNGRGIDPEATRASRDAHWGLLGMDERAKSIGAKLTIWSKPGAGTEVELPEAARARAAPGHDRGTYRGRRVRARHHVR